jgi:dienelactone hydrolase
MRRFLRGMRIAAATAIVSAAASVLGTTAQSRAQEAAWLGGDTVQVAAQRMGLNGSHSSEPLLGFLARPNMPGRHPAVVVLHGCSGFRPDYPVIADVLKSYGYVALALDSLGELSACNGSSGDVAESFDAYTALDWLARQDFVDPDRVALLGFSMGGNAALNNVETGPGAIEKTQSRHFRAAIAYYPSCRYREGVMTVPTLILIDVHGKEAAAVAGENARVAALAGQAEKAKYWIRVLGTVQRQQAGKVPPQRPVASADATDDLSDDNAVSREPCPGPAGPEGTLISRSGRLCGTLDQGRSRTDESADYLKERAKAACRIELDVPQHHI